MRPSTSRRCSWGHSALQTHSPSVEPWAKKATKFPREDSPTGQFESWKWHYQLRSRSRLRWHQNPLPECWRQSSTSFPSSPRSGPPSKWLCLHMQDLKLQTRTQEFRSRVWQGRAPALADENPKKEPRFNINKVLGGEPTFPTCVTLYLSGGETIEWYTDLTPTTTWPIDTLWPDHEEGPQWSSTPTGGARPKVWSYATQFPLRPEGPDPVSHPCRWNHAEMLKIPHIPWWKTLMPSGKRTMFSYVLCKSLNKLEALHLAHWQAVAFWLPQAQQEAARWWTPPLAIPGLHLKDYMPSPTSYNFWIMRQQKTMVLARVLQACAEESGFPKESSVMRHGKYNGVWLPC